MGRIIEIREKGVVITEATPQNIVDKYIKDYPQLNKLKNGKKESKPAKP